LAPLILALRTKASCGALFFEQQPDVQRFFAQMGIATTNAVGMNGIAGFLYLPTLEHAPALRILHAAVARLKYQTRLGRQCAKEVERS
jgi:hypothetical protein